MMIIIMQSIGSSHDDLKRLQIGVRAEGVALRVPAHQLTSSPAHLPGHLGVWLVRPRLIIQSLLRTFQDTRSRYHSLILYY